MHLSLLHAKWRKGKIGGRLRLASMGERGFLRSSSIYLLGLDEVSCGEAHLRPSNEGKRARETRARSLPPHPAREVGVLKWHGVGEAQPWLSVSPRALKSAAARQDLRS
jgi:hypothetical protein